jgi:hypothetical protein
VRRDHLVALVDPLSADRVDEPLDGLRLDVQVRKFGEVA